MVRNTSDQIAIEVRNTGPAHSIRSTHADGEGFGLRSIKERLAGHFGERASFTLTRDEGKEVTIARIVMPHVRIAAS
jgi:signal transduction histidine kinase